MKKQVLVVIVVLVTIFASAQKRPGGTYTVYPMEGGTEKAQIVSLDSVSGDTLLHYGGRTYPMIEGISKEFISQLKEAYSDMAANIKKKDRHMIFYYGTIPKKYWKKYPTKNSVPVIGVTFNGQTCEVIGIGVK